MKVISFDLKGDFGFFRKPDTNNTVNFTYNLIHKPAILGILGAIIGLDGYKKKGELPDYYKKLKDIKIGIQPLSGKNGINQKTVIAYSNTIGYANKDGNFITKEATLIEPSFRIYLGLDLSNEYAQKVYNNIKGGIAEYVPYFGKNEFHCWWEKESVKEYDECVPVDNTYNSFKMISIFEKNEAVKGNTESIFDLMNIDTSQPTFLTFERIPKGYNAILNQYELGDFVFTNNILEKDYHIENLYTINDSEYVQLMTASMYNCFKTLKELINEQDSVDKILKNASQYFAHIPYGYTAESRSGGKLPETLNEHVSLVNEYAVKLCEAHKLDNVINNLVCALFEDNNIEFDLDVANFIKKMWVNVVVFHDYGKINPNFQSEKMGNGSFTSKEDKNSPIDNRHSSLGAYLYIAKNFQEILLFDTKYQALLTLVNIAFSYSIFKHHSSYLGDNVADDVNFKSDEVEYIKRFIEEFEWTIESHCYEVLPKKLKNIFDELQKRGVFNSHALFSLIKLSFSLLTSSDFLATGQYMNSIVLDIKDFGILSKDRINEIYNKVSNDDWLDAKKSKTNFNKITFENSNNSNYEFKNPKEQSNENLNKLRQEMGIEVIRNIRANSDKNLFYIEAPTGGGKTNLSFLATIELLKSSERLNKVFYVFPFTTLVTQTEKSIVVTFGLTEDEVITLSSKSGFKVSNQDEEEDANYGGDKKYYVENLFSLFPFCLLTHIKFFNILKGNSKQDNYLLHRIANSIVVIDELQAYSPAEWDKVIFFIKHYAKHYNIKFIVMSATLPKLDKLTILKENVEDFVYLIENAHEKYFLNPNFAGRVSFNLDWFNEKELSLECIADKLLEVSKEYSQIDGGQSKPKGSVYTIIEFIFKKTASEFYDIISNRSHNFFNEIFVLSGTILEHRRKYIINYLKNSNNRTKKILLITTQVVEAGVDIDMDLGFKDRSIIDSDEQLAGRINRNVNKKDCTLYLFNYNNEKMLYGKDKRYEMAKGMKIQEYEKVLKDKSFDIIYNKVLNSIDEWNKKEGAVGFIDYETYLKKVMFSSVDSKFQLISKEQKNISVFIPLNILVENSGNSNFSTTEITYLKQNKIVPNSSNEIEGEKVYQLFLDLIGNKKRSSDFINKMIDNKKLQGIMSKFVISMIGTDKVKGQLASFQDKEKSKFGFIYLRNWRDIYDQNFGIISTNLDSTETQFL